MRKFGLVDFFSAIVLMFVLLIGIVWLFDGNDKTGQTFWIKRCVCLDSDHCECPKKKHCECTKKE